MTRTTVAPGITWVHLVAPKPEELAALQREFNLHELIVRELHGPSSRGKAEHHGNYLYLVLHIPLWNAEDQTSRRGEVDCVMTRAALLTVTYEALEPLETLAERIRGNDPALGSITSTAQLAHALVQTVNDFSLRQLQHIEEKVQNVGARIFKRQDRALLEEIGRIKRDILDFSIIAASQRTTIESIATGNGTVWTAEDEIYRSDLVGSALKIDYLIERLQVTIESHSDMLSQLFQMRTAEVIRRFSIVGFLTVPLILYSTIALQPSVVGDHIRTSAEFWGAFAVVAVFVGILATIFHRKGLL